ncbi:hypothetical protein [Massilia endophytica]|uniref:hypothetical protein n=1 Tax=Massilia endophytica TaxID=2899220 RepID=UPI001E28EEC0|nr:hypothetical protein [Massilia endophytica]UGQ48642.1 hypothetical protein LSQ66_09330 [Massilia endophytica]
MSKTGFKPFANESDVLNVGGLAVENRVDRVSLHGGVDLTRDRAGLEQARALHKLLGEVVARLEGEELPAALPAPKVKKVANPFE